MAHDANKGAGIWEALFGAFGRAVDDINQKVVQEPWFGRAMTQGDAAADRSVAEDLGWTSREKTPAEQAADLAHDLHVLKDMGFDIDR